MMASSQGSIDYTALHEDDAVKALGLLSEMAFGGTTGDLAGLAALQVCSGRHAKQEGVKKRGGACLVEPSRCHFCAARPVCF